MFTTLPVKIRGARQDPGWGDGASYFSPVAPQYLHPAQERGGKVQGLLRDLTNVSKTENIYISI